MLSPRTARPSLACQELLDKCFDRHIVSDLPDLAVIVILRNHHIPRIANDVDHARISRIETLMALDDPRPLHPIENPCWSAQRVWNQNRNIGESRRLVWRNKVANE